ncbi:hypothetical protein [Ferroplasma sp.]|jgi:hypothetical protein|uniref:hypothetical protein n=1 Tax=Ferroplasma sp. TaxID=2591003 RepID=UPI00262592B2|nr:hypothetical protein [Ferroplasma sp.]
MNKKLAVLLVVPILLAMGGTFAFSAFSGNSSIAINNTAGHLTWTNDMVLIATNAHNTPLTVQGPNGHIYTVGVPITEPQVPVINLGTQSFTTANSGREYTVNVSNFAPGEYVVFIAAITNNGTVGFVVSSEAPSFTTSSNSTYIGTGNSIVATPVSASPFSASEPSFAADLQSSTGYIYNVTEECGFNTSLSPGGTAIMLITVGLGNSNGHDVNYYQGSDFSLNINLNVVSDP